MANERPILTVTQLNEYVKGIIDYFDGDYQIKVFRPSDIIIH